MGSGGVAQTAIEIKDKAELDPIAGAINASIVQLQNR